MLFGKTDFLMDGQRILKDTCLRLTRVTQCILLVDTIRTL